MAFQNHADKNKESIIKSCSQQFSTVKTIWREINLWLYFLSIHNNIDTKNLSTLVNMYEKSEPTTP